MRPLCDAKYETSSSAVSEWPKASVRCDRRRISNFSTHLDTPHLQVGRCCRYSTTTGRITTSLTCSRREGLVAAAQPFAATAAGGRSASDDLIAFVGGNEGLFKLLMSGLSAPYTSGFQLSFRFRLGVRILGGRWLRGIAHILRQLCLPLSHPFHKFCVAFFLLSILSPPHSNNGLSLGGKVRDLFFCDLQQHARTCPGFCDP